MKPAGFLVLIGILCCFMPSAIAGDIPEDLKANRDQIMEDLKGTRDIASAIERLAQEDKIIYDQSTPQDLREEVTKDGMTKKEIDEATREKAQEYTGSADPPNIPYVRRANCYEAVHLAGWIAGRQEGLLYSYSNTIRSTIVNVQEWDFQSPIPRGKVIIGTLPREEGGQGSDGTFHFGVSLGNGKVASTRSVNKFWKALGYEGGLEIEDATDAFGPWMYWWFGGKVYYGDYAPYAKEDVRASTQERPITGTRTEDQLCPESVDWDRVETVGTAPSPTSTVGSASSLSVCIPCVDIAKALLDAQAKLVSLEARLKNIDFQIDFYNHAEKKTTDLIGKARNEFDKLLKTKVSSTDPDTKIDYSETYTEEGKGQTTITHPDGRTETITWNSKRMSLLNENLGALNDRMKDIQKSRSELEKLKTDLGNQIARAKAEIEKLKEALTDCIRKYCNAQRVTLVFDRGDCKFGGGVITVDLGPPPTVPVDRPDGPGDAPVPSKTPPETPVPPDSPEDSQPGDTPAPPESPKDDPKTDSPPIQPPSVEPPKVPIPPVTKPPEEEPPAEQPPAESPADVPPPTIVIIVKATEKTLEQGRTIEKDFGQALIKVPGVEPPLPIAGQTKDEQTGHDSDPVYPEKGPGGELKINLGPANPSDRTLGAQQVNIDLTPHWSVVVGFIVDPEDDANPKIPEEITPYITNSFRIDGTHFVALQYPQPQKDEIQTIVDGLPGVRFVELNFCRKMETALNDPYLASKSTWRQEYDDQWAVKRVGFTTEENSAWKLAAGTKPVVVAVVDTGLDWNHQDISWDNIWKNTREVPENGIDDDQNGYVDDVIGWDFFERNSKPWDHSGHGTFVTGIIAATQNNRTGIAGINPHARIMVLKALDSFGHTRASYIAEAITYAADNGARVINVSVGGMHLTRTEQMAIDYAHSKGAIVVVAAGNEATDVGNFSPAGLQNTLTVGSTDTEDKRAPYSNYGAGIDIAAPGNDILSLRARRTDLMRDVTGITYKPGEGYVGRDRRYYRASGTSFSAPIVAGTASLILSLRPELTNVEVERMIVQSARDIETPGLDYYSGFGLLSARDALSADPEFFVTPVISGVEVVTEGTEAKVQVRGTAEADRFQSAFLEMGAGKKPSEWKKVGAPITQPVPDGIIGAIPPSALRGSADWTIRLVVSHQNGKQRETRFYLKLQ